MMQEDSLIVASAPVSDLSDIARKFLFLFDGTVHGEASEQARIVLLIGSTHLMCNRCHVGSGKWQQLLENGFGQGGTE
jgi:hypothetical protein